MDKYSVAMIIMVIVTFLLLASLVYYAYKFDTIAKKICNTQRVNCGREIFCCLMPDKTLRTFACSDNECYWVK